MPKAMIHYFTGTGNTARMADLLAQGLLAGGYEVVVKQVERDMAPNEEKADLHIFAFPVYAFAAPELMLRYLRWLPNGEAARTAVIAVHGQTDKQKTGGGSEGQALEQVRRILRRRKYDVFYTNAVGYPASFTQIMPPPVAQDEADIVREVESKVQQITRSILENYTSHKPCSPMNQFWTRLATYAFMLFGRRFLGKVYIADKNCTACGKCAHACPAAVIKLEKGRPHWNMQCQDCQRCINICPTQAIQTSYLRFGVLFLILLLPFFLQGIIRTELNLDPISHIPVIGLVFDLSLWLGLWFGLLYIVEWVIFILEFIPPVRWLSSLTFTRNFRRYLEPHFKAPIHKEESR